MAASVDLLFLFALAVGGIFEEFFLPLGQAGQAAVVNLGEDRVNLGLLVGPLLHFSLPCAFIEAVFYSL